MASLIYLDTHVAVWLYALGRESLSSTAAEMIEEADDLRISPMARLELHYLYEIGRVTEPAAVVFDALHAALGLELCGASFGAVIREAERHSWTRDPFDRLIVAQASLHDAALVTKDDALRAKYGLAVW